MREKKNKQKGKRRELGRVNKKKKKEGRAGTGSVVDEKRRE